MGHFSVVVGGVGKDLGVWGVGVWVVWYEERRHRWNGWNVALALWGILSSSVELLSLVEDC